MRASAAIFGGRRYERWTGLEEQQHDLRLIGGCRKMNGLLTKLIHAIHAGTEIDQEAANIQFAWISKLSFEKLRNCQKNKKGECLYGPDRAARCSGVCFFMV